MVRFITWQAEQNKSADADLDGVNLRWDLDRAAELDGCASLVKPLALELLLVLVAGDILPV